MELPFVHDDCDPFVSIGSSRARKQRPVEVCEHSAYALLDKVPSEVPPDWPRHQIYGHPLDPGTIKTQERTKFALELYEREVQRKEGHVSQGKAAAFSTAYAIAWGRAQGWKLLDRERYDYRLKQHRDLVLGSDAMMETPRGIVLIQGAGKSERAKHWERFCQRGGVERCERLKLAFVYVEFCRESKEPMLRQWWSPFS